MRVKDGTGSRGNGERLAGTCNRRVLLKSELNGIIGNINVNGRVRGPRIEPIHGDSAGNVDRGSASVKDQVNG